MGIMNFDSRKSAADYFAPEKTSLLFLAEAPPCSLERYFYFPNVREQDALWVELMKAIYSGQFGEVGVERYRKMEWLKKFQSDGYRLIDAVKEPFCYGESSTARKKQIKSCLDDIVDEIWEINPKQILTIKVTVYDALYQDLRNLGLPVVKDRRLARLPFPGSGRQTEFQYQFKCLVDSGKISLT